MLVMMTMERHVEGPVKMRGSSPVYLMVSNTHSSMLREFPHPPSGASGFSSRPDVERSEVDTLQSPFPEEYLPTQREEASDRCIFHGEYF